MRPLEMVAFYKNRIPNPGKCKIISIDFEERTASVSNGVFRLFPSLDEIDIVMPIGRSDIEGTPILEGDIVSLVVIEDELKGHKTATKAVVRWDEEDAGYYFETEYDKFPHVKPWFAEKVKVIGNIFETPEKLKEEG